MATRKDAPGSARVSGVLWPQRRLSGRTPRREPSPPAKFQPVLAGATSLLALNGGQHGKSESGMKNIGILQNGGLIFSFKAGLLISSTFKPVRRPSAHQSKPQSVACESPLVTASRVPQAARSLVQIESSPLQVLLF